jgi:hypothetical protein
MEGRVEQKNTRWQGNKAGTLMPGTLSTKLHRITETAKQKSYVFGTLAHLITEEALAWSFREFRRDAAAGIDEVSVQDYEKNLSANLKDLHRRLRERCYRAQALRRVYIEKEDGKQRPGVLPIPEGCGAFSRGFTEAVREVRPQAASRQNASDSLWPASDAGCASGGKAQAGDFRVSGIHVLLREIPGREIRGEIQDDDEAAQTGVTSMEPVVSG